MSDTRYFDDPDEGLSRDTSHPRFVALAADDFYYDEAYDFSPFGSDDGNDVLRDLESWYQEESGAGSVSDFVADVLQDWNFGVPVDMLRADATTRNAWLRQGEMHEPYLAAECRAWVAAAFGQLKITGQIDPPLHAQALAAIDCQLGLNEYARTRHPDWPHADEERTCLQKLRGALVQAGAAA